MDMVHEILVLLNFISLCSCFPYLNQTDIPAQNDTDIWVSVASYGRNNFPLLLLLASLFGAGVVLAVVYSFVMIGRIILRKKEPAAEKVPLCDDEFELPIDPQKKYKPVVCIHGLLDPTFSMDIMEEAIKVYHPGTQVTVIRMYNGISSFANLWEQIEKFKVEVEKVAAESPQGIHLIGISQGCIIARGVLETSDKHNVDTFISIAGPHMGQYGLSLFDRIPGYKWLMSSLYKYFYTQKGQNYSVPEYWKDPNHIDLYKTTNKFLPVLNNEVQHSRSEEFKKNFTQIKTLVLIGGPNDDCITPWQSSHFAFYDDKLNIVPMEQQEIYINDTLGLKTIDEKKGIIMHTVPHVFHQFFALDIPCMKKYIIPHLT